MIIVMGGGAGKPQQPKYVPRPKRKPTLDELIKLVKRFDACLEYADAVEEVGGSQNAINVARALAVKIKRKIDKEFPKWRASRDHNYSSDCGQANS